MSVTRAFKIFTPPIYIQAISCKRLNGRKILKHERANAT